MTLTVDKGQPFNPSWALFLYRRWPPKKTSTNEHVKFFIANPCFFSRGQKEEKQLQEVKLQPPETSDAGTESWIADSVSMILFHVLHVYQTCMVCLCSFSKGGKLWFSDWAAKAFEKGRDLAILILLSSFKALHQKKSLTFAAKSAEFGNGNLAN